MKNLLIVLVLLLPPSSHAQECLENVAVALERLDKKPSVFRIKTNGLIKERAYSASWRNKFGIDNHFQGIKVFNNHKHFVISGSDIHRRKGELFFGKFNRFGGELTHSEVMPGNPLLWHGGGMGLLDNILSVPNDDYRKNISNIYFYKLQKDGKPKLMEKFLARNFSNSGALDANFLETGEQFLLSFNHHNIQAYFGGINDLKSEPHLTAAHDMFKGSNVESVRQCDGKLFLLEFYNNGLLPPLIGGSDRVKVYALEIDKENKKLTASFVKRHVFSCGSHCNFSASAGASVKDKKLSIFATPHYKDGESISIAIFQ